MFTYRYSVNVVSAQKLTVAQRKAIKMDACLTLNTHVDCYGYFDTRTAHLTAKAAYPCANCDRVFASRIKLAEHQAEEAAHQWPS